MGYGTLSGVTKDWTPKEIKDAKFVGLSFTPETRNTSTTTPPITPVVPATTPTPAIPIAPSGTTGTGTPTGGGIVSGANTGVATGAVTPTPGVGGVQAPVVQPQGTQGGVVQGGASSAGGVQSGTAQPQDTTQNLSLRDVATAARIEIGNQGNMPTVNGVQIDPVKAGLQLIDGRWQGTPAQIASVLGVPVGLRAGLEAAGRTVAYDPNTGQVTVNNMPINTSDMMNIGGQNYTNQNRIDEIILQTSGQVPSGQESSVPKGDVVPKEQAGEKPFDNSIEARLAEETRKNQELQFKIDEMGKTKVPGEDFTRRNELLSQMQDRKGLYDENIKQVLQETFKGFDYNPDNDLMLQNAIKFADRSMMEEMNRRGILSSTITVDNARSLYEDLMPKYQDMAFQRYNQSLNNNFKKIEVMQSLNNDDYERYKNFVSLSMDTADRISKNTVDTVKDNLTIMQNSLTNQMALNKQDAETKAQAYKDAWAKFQELGYVDNEISILTKLPSGMRSKEAQAEIQKRYDEYNKLTLQFENQLLEMKQQHEYDMQKVDITTKEKKMEEERKAAAGKVYASLGNMPATQALDEVGKNFATLNEYLGSELWTLVDKLNEQKTAETKAQTDKEQNAIENTLKSRQLDISQQNTITKQENKPMSTAEKNQYISEAIRTYESWDTEPAVQFLLEDADQLIADVGVAGYKQIWDMALGKAVKRGETKLFKDYFKEPKKETSLSKVDELTDSIMKKYNIKID
jgi:hypothetical protein